MSIKHILIAIMVISTIYAANYTLAGSGTETIEMSIDANSSNSSNFDIVITNKVVDLADGKSQGVACVDTKQSTFNPVNDTTGLEVFIYIQTASGAASFNGATETLLVTTAAYANSTGAYTMAASTAVSGLSPTETLSNSDLTSAQAFSGLTPTQLGSWNLPISGEKFYWR